MATIRYTKTYFNKPKRINEEAYNVLKRELIRNPNFELDPNPETFSEHFSGELKFLKWSAIYLIFFVIIYDPLIEDNNLDGTFIDWILAIPAIIAGLGSFFTFFQGLLLEGPSYATFLKEKSNYFSNMKYAIVNTNSYRDFCMTFYGN